MIGELTANIQSKIANACGKHDVLHGLDNSLGIFLCVLGHAANHVGIDHHSYDPAFALGIFQNSDAAGHKSNHQRIGCNHFLCRDTVAEVKYFYSFGGLSGKSLDFLV